MVNQTNQFETGLDDDIALLTETLEEVLKASGDPADQKYIELKSKAEQALNDVKSRVSQASDSYYYRAKQAAYRADDYVHENRGRVSVSVQQPVWYLVCCWRVANRDSLTQL